MAQWAGSSVCLCLLLALLASLPWPSLSQDCDEYKETLCTGKPLLSVEYDGVSLDCDGLYRKDETQNTPSVDFAESEEGTMYLLVVTDPDAPIPCAPNVPEGDSFLHYMAVMQRQHGRLRVASTEVRYHGPSPPAGTHRYQFRLFRLNSKPPKLPPGTPRSNYRVEDLQEHLNLGDPVAQFQFKVAAQLS